jgi:hypothetical protein
VKPARDHHDGDGRRCPGFGASKRRGSLRVHQRTPADVIGYVVLVGLISTAIALNHFHDGACPY